MDPSLPVPCKPMTVLDPAGTSPRHGAATAAAAYGNLPPIVVSRMAFGPPAWPETVGDDGRTCSPFGKAALASPCGLGAPGSASDDGWRMRRRVMKDPLVPIEETLRLRRGLQVSMSSPQLLTVGKPSVGSPGKRGRARREAAAVSTNALWVGAAESGSTLLQRCLSPSSRESQNVSSQSSSLSATSSSAFFGDTGAARRPRIGSLPADVVLRIKDRGWTQNSVWVRQAHELTSARAGRSPLAPGKKCPPGANDRSIHERLRLLELLESEGLPQGLEALCVALRWRCGSLENAFVYLDVGGRGGHGAGLSVSELAGGLALLGLDAPALCGFSEAEAHQRLDANHDGYVCLPDLLKGGLGAGEPPPAATATDSRNGAWGEATERWVALAKFVALSAWFQTPQPLRSRKRPGVMEGPALTPLSPPPGPTGSATIAMVTAAADRRQGTFGGEQGAMARQQPIDAVRRFWAPSAGDFQEARRLLQEKFSEHALVQQFNERLLGKSDAFRLLGDLPPAGIGRDQALPLTHATVGELFEEALRTQIAQSSPASCALSKGLTFEFLTVFLHKVALALGLNFRHLVDDALDARAAARLSGE